MISMRVAIVGSRNYPHLHSVRVFVASLARKYPGAIVVSGGARGVDRIAVVEAKAHGMQTAVFPAYWDDEGRAAGFRRNERMINTLEPGRDKLVAFWDGKSGGTRHAITYARRRGVDVYLYGVRG